MRAAIKKIGGGNGTQQATEIEDPQGEREQIKRDEMMLLLNYVTKLIALQHNMCTTKKMVGQRNGMLRAAVVYEIAENIQ